ncbi:MAG: bifunctional phosphoribosyl-AMP cyclohydrolase/phosphoribosyl-ATP diphosphatase HisIE [Nitrospinae bacterium]|nr:bifunctional phosphoribosyl-AMP cyclohydrolase/phosphoribosyl-ATP diphosphatase HisIE [Nitrospinota bacterium]
MIQFDYSSLKYDTNGLIPAIIQDVKTKDVLMMAYMNQEALKKTCETGETWFWSRSRKEFWNKGATSGNRQKVFSLSFDCDSDTLLILVEQLGNGACHTGEYSCFFNTFFEDKESKSFSDPLMMQKLEKLIQERKKSLPEGSYTTTLFQKGLDTILKKIGEEASEVIIASKDDDRQHTIYECADLLYHLTVLLVEKQINIEEVHLELGKRFNVGGFKWKEEQGK